MQKILLIIVKASHVIFYSCDKLIFDNNEEPKDILSMLIDSVALLSLSTVETNLRYLMKHGMPVHLQKLTKNVSSDSNILFADDIRQRINQISATNSVLREIKFE